MVWLPPSRAVVAHVAVPVELPACQVIACAVQAPIGVLLSAKATVPVNATVPPAGALTVAVNVTDPFTLMFALEVAIAVVVDALFTVTFVVLLVLVL